MSNHLALVEDESAEQEQTSSHTSPEKIDISRKNFHDRIQFLNIDAETRESLIKLKPIMEKHLGGVLDDFYELVSEWPELNAFFKDKSHQNAAKNLQMAHWANIVTGKFDESYLESAKKIGHVHNRIGLEPRWYIGGYAALMGGVFSAMIQEYFTSGMLSRGKKTKEFEKITQAFVKAALLDMDLAISTYFDAGKGEFNQLLTQITQGFDQNIASFIKELKLASDDLSDISANLSDLATNGQGRADSLQNAASVAAENVSAVAGASEEMSASIKEINTQINRANSITGEAVEKSREAETTVSQLQDSSLKVGDIVKLIQDIAEQTNLLALNATIESARAGEAGKGFAVVASEVKNLAGETAKATEEISRQITSIQESTKNTVDVISGITQTIEQINEISIAITAAMEEQSATISEIVKNTHSAADKTTQVGTIAKEVASGSVETQTAAGTLHEASSDLAKRTERLRGEVEVFLSNVKASID